MLHKSRSHNASPLRLTGDEPLRVRSLGRIILVRVLVATILVLIAYEGFAFQASIARSRRDFESGVKVNLQRLAKSLSTPLWYLDDETVRQILEAAVQDPLIQSVRLERSDQGPSVYAADRASSADLPPQWIYDLMDSPLLVHASMDLEFVGSVIGSLTIDCVNLQLWQAWNEAMRRILVEFILFCLLYAVVINLGYVFLIAGPLKAIQETLDAISQGNFAHPTKLRRKDEFWLLAKGVSDMARELESSYSRLEDHNRSLETTVRERTDSLVESEKRAVVSKLVAGVAHELNTPIGVIMTANSYLQAQLQVFLARLDQGGLRKSDLERIVRQGLEGTEIIARNVSSAASMISSFKQVAPDHFVEELSRFSLLRNFQELLPTFQRLVEKAGAHISLTGDPDDWVVNYPNYLVQIAFNLLMNTASYAWDDSFSGERTVEMKVSRQDGLLTFWYANNGAPLAPEMQERVFEPFFTTQRQSGSTGLGLYIVKNIIQQQVGGTISLVSPLKDGFGVGFRMTIPDLESSPSPAAKNSGVDGAG